jgi:hypothetical protein
VRIGFQPRTDRTPLNTSEAGSIEPPAFPLEISSRNNMTCSWSAKPFAQYVHTRDQHTEDQDTKTKTPRPRQSLPIFWLSLNDARRDCASERSSHHDKPDNPEGCQKPASLLCRVVYPMVVNNGMLYSKAAVNPIKFRGWRLQQMSDWAQTRDLRSALPRQAAPSPRRAQCRTFSSEPIVLDRAATASRRPAHHEITNRLRTPRPPKSLPICNMAWTKLCANVGAAQALPTSTR